MHKLHTQFAGCRLSAPRQTARQQPYAQRQHNLTVHARSSEAGMGMFGTKAGMTQIFTPEGLSLPATVIALEDGNVVTQVHTMDKSGYNAVQVGYQECAERKITQPEAGHCKKAGANAMRHLREFKVGTPKHRTSFLLHTIPPLVAHNLQSGQAYIPSYPKMWRHYNVPKIQCVLNGLQCFADS